MGNITILGAGAMGAALCVPLDENGHQCRLWGTSHDSDILSDLREGQAHPRLGTPIPESVQLFESGQLAAALKEVNLIVLAVSTAGIVPVVNKLMDHTELLDSCPPILTIAKGISLRENHPETPVEALQGICSEHPSMPSPPLVSMGGPSIAAELASHRPTAVLFAANTSEDAERTAKIFRTKTFHVQTGTDLVGTELCKGLKNIYAISLTWTAGLEKQANAESMSNAQSFLFVQALNELQKIVQAAGGVPETVTGLVGLGDFITTSEQGRNGQFGKLLGKGNTADEAMAVLQERNVGVVEGYNSLDPAMQKLDKLQHTSPLNASDLPLLYGIRSVIRGEASAREVIREVGQQFDSPSSGL